MIVVSFKNKKKLFYEENPSFEQDLKLRKNYQILN